MPTVIDQAFLLKKINYLERDQILTMLTREHGKMTFFAKGGQVSKRRFTHIDFFTSLKIEFSTHIAKPVVRIFSGTIDAIYPGVRKDLLTFAAASYITEIVSQVVPVRQVESQVFQLYQSFMESISAGDDKKRVLGYFLVKITGASGFPMNVEHPPVALSADAKAMIDVFTHGDITAASNLTVSLAVTRELIEAYNAHLGQLFKKNLRSSSFLMELL